MADTQYYVRDAVIDYTKAQTAPISPAIEGRLAFQNTPPLQTQTKTFNPSQDTVISAGQPTSGQGQSAMLYFGGNDVLRSPVKFDLSTIATSGTVEKATLSSISSRSRAAARPADLQAFEITTPWTEATATWKTPWTNKGGDFIATARGQQADQQG